MAAGERSPAESAYLQGVHQASALAAVVLGEMERVAEALAPERSRTLAEAVDARFTADIARAAAALAAAPPPPDFERFQAVFAPAFEHTRRCVALFTGFPYAPASARIGHIPEALHHHAQAQEHFYVLRTLLPPFTDYWTTPAARAAEGAEPPPDPARPPLVRVAAGGHHGGFALYVPEAYDASRAWPLIVALHGGSGNGRDFLWTWMREVRSRGYLLVAPSSARPTWAESDDRGEILAWLHRPNRLAPERVLLTASPTAPPSRSSSASSIPRSIAPSPRAAASSIRSASTTGTSSAPAACRSTWSTGRKTSSSPSSTPT